MMNQFETVYDRNSCCWNCKKPGHKSAECKDEKQLFCSFCQKSGVTTLACDCRRPSTPKPTPRLVRFNAPLASNNILRYPLCPNAYKAPIIPIGVEIGNQSFPCYIDTSREQTVVGWKVATKAVLVYGDHHQLTYSSDGVLTEAVIPLKINETIRALKCKVVDSPNDIITLGTDGLQCFGCVVEVAGVSVFDRPGCTKQEHQSCYDIPLMKEIQPENTTAPNKRIHNKLKCHNSARMKKETTRTDPDYPRLDPDQNKDVME